jgi:hypothetical protein
MPQITHGTPGPEAGPSTLHEQSLITLTSLQKRILLFFQKDEAEKLSGYELASGMNITAIVRQF